MTMEMKNWRKDQTFGGRTSLAPASEDIPMSQPSTSSSQTTSSSKKGARAKQNRNVAGHLLDLAHKTLTADEDEYLIAGRRIGYQLKEVDEHQRIIAEKLLFDVMYYARLGKLRDDAAVYCTAMSQNVCGSSKSDDPTYSLSQPVLQLQSVQAQNNEPDINLRQYFSNYDPELQ